MTAITRKDLIENIQTSLKSQVPIIGAGVGTGLVAKAAAAGGADFLVVYCTSVARHRGFPTSIIGDPNTMMLDLLPDVIRAAGAVPVIAGIQATDPARNIENDLLPQVRDMACAGVINYPSMGLYGREYIGGPTGYTDGLEIEHSMLQKARDEDLFAITYSYRPEEAKFFADAADMIVAHAGWTSGGLAGNTTAVGHETAAQVVEDHYTAATSVTSDIFVLAHGGPYVRPNDTKELYRRTRAMGLVGASSIDRIPVEEAVSQVVSDFKNHQLTTARN